METSRILAIDEETLDMVMRIQRSIVENGLNLMGCSLGPTTLQDCVDELKERSNVTMTLAQMVYFIDLHPILKADIYENAIGDTQTRENFVHAVCNFLMGCPWTDDARLHKLMQNQVDGIKWFYADHAKKTTRSPG